MKCTFTSLFSKQTIESFKCDICYFSKYNWSTFSPNDLIHFDVWEPFHASNISHVRWFVSFIDDCFQETLFFLKNNKSEVLSQLFIQFYNTTQAQFGKDIKIICRYNGK